MKLEASLVHMQQVQDEKNDLQEQLQFEKNVSSEINHKYNKLKIMYKTQQSELDKERNEND